MISRAFLLKWGENTEKQLFIYFSLHWSRYFSSRFGSSECSSLWSVMMEPLLKIWPIKADFWFLCEWRYFIANLRVSSFETSIICTWCWQMEQIAKILNVNCQKVLWLQKKTLIQMYCVNKLFLVIWNSLNYISYIANKLRWTKLTQLSWDKGFSFEWKWNGDVRAKIKQTYENCCQIRSTKL